MTSFSPTKCEALEDTPKRLHFMAAYSDSSRIFLGTRRCRGEMPIASKTSGHPYTVGAATRAAVDSKGTKTIRTDPLPWMSSQNTFSFYIQRKNFFWSLLTVNSPNQHKSFVIRKYERSFRQLAAYGRVESTVEHSLTNRTDHFRYR